MSKNIAVILAGGSGSRFGSKTPKQFFKLAGKTIIEHTIEAFEEHDSIDEICVVIKAEFKLNIENIVLQNKYKKVKKILEGGEERKDSSLSAIMAYRGNDDYNLIFHDAVRPFVSVKIIDNIISSLDQYNAIDVAIPATDTIIEVEQGFITNIPKRSNMMQGQTPQAFKLKTIKKAYELAELDKDFLPTDDCGVVKKFLPDEKIFVVEGSFENMKITHRQDLAIADRIFQSKSIQGNFIHNDEHYKEKFQNKVLVVFGGSYGIGADIAKLASEYGAKVESFSRSTTNTNVAVISDVERDLKYVFDKYGKIDYVVNTASILLKQPLEVISYNEISDTIRINYLGAIIVAKESYKYLEKTKGQILNFTSSSYTRGRANYVLYSSSKAAIVNLTQALSEEYALSQVRVNCINPQRTATPMRTSNFGIEDPDTLLTSQQVAYSSINTLLADFTGQIVDVVLRK